MNRTTPLLNAIAATTLAMAAAPTLGAITSLADGKVNVGSYTAIPNLDFGAVQERQDGFTPGGNASLGLAAQDEVTFQDVIQGHPDHYVAPQPVTWSNRGAGYAHGTVEAGVIKGRVIAQAFVGPWEQSYKYVYGGGMPIEVIKRNPAPVTTTVEGNFAYREAFTVGSDGSLADGATVKLALTSALHADVDKPYPNETNAAMSYVKVRKGGADYTAPATAQAYDDGETTTTGIKYVYLKVGETYEIEAGLTLLATAINADHYDAQRDLILPGSHDVTAGVNALNTSRFFVDVETAGAVLTFESGHSYATAVPEPATLAALAAPLALGACRRRR